MKTLLRKSALRPTKFMEIISGWLNYIEVKHVFGHGIGGFLFGKTFSCTPTVSCMQWPEWVKREIISSSNHTGALTNSYLEMARLLLLCLMIEDVCEVKSGDHVAIFIDNQPTVSWVELLASKISVVTGQLLRALALRFKIKEHRH